MWSAPEFGWTILIQKLPPHIQQLWPGPPTRNHASLSRSPDNVLAQTERSRYAPHAWHPRWCHIHHPKSVLDTARDDYLGKKSRCWYPADSPDGPDGPVLFSPSLWDPRFMILTHSITTRTYTWFLPALKKNLKQESEPLKCLRSSCWGSKFVTLPQLPTIANLESTSWRSWYKVSEAGSISSSRICLGTGSDTTGYCSWVTCEEGYCITWS